LEKKAGIGYGILSRLEAGKGGITVDTLIKIAKALDLPPAYFLD
jgi:transcriptional regulator with XRE-family HTH domain